MADKWAGGNLTRRRWDHVAFSTEKTWQIKTQIRKLRLQFQLKKMMILLF